MRSSLDVYITTEYAKLDRFFMKCGMLMVLGFIAGLGFTAWLEQKPFVW